MFEHNDTSPLTIDKGRTAKALAWLTCVLLCMLLQVTSQAYAEDLWQTRTTLHAGYDAQHALTDEQITALLTAAFSMPTGGNQRALDFYVVTDRETMQGMKGGNPYAQAMDTAPCVIVIAADLDLAFYDELLEMDAGLAAGGLLLKASELGITSCVLSIAPQEERIHSVQTSLDMPETVRPILMIALGYPQADSISSASVMQWQDAQVHWTNAP